MVPSNIVTCKPSLDRCGKLMTWMRTMRQGERTLGSRQRLNFIVIMIKKLVIIIYHHDAYSTSIQAALVEKLAGRIKSYVVRHRVAVSSSSSSYRRHWHHITTTIIKYAYQTCISWIFDTKSTHLMIISPWFTIFITHHQLASIRCDPQCLSQTFWIRWLKDLLILGKTTPLPRSEEQNQISHNQILARF